MDPKMFLLLHGGAGGRAPTRISRLQVDGRFFANDHGTFRPVFASGLSLLSKSDEQIIEFLEWAGNEGFNGLRVFAGFLGWANQTPAAARAKLPFLLERAAARGFYVLISAITGSNDDSYDLRAHIDAIGGIASAHENALVEIANEYGHPSQRAEVHDPAILASLAGRIPTEVLTAIGAGGTDEPDLNGMYDAGGGAVDFVCVHLDRGRDPWNQIRRVRELENVSGVTGRPVFNSEPIGADEQDGSVTHRQRLNRHEYFFALGALNRICEISGVFHSQAGLHGELPGPVQQACAEAFVTGSRIIPTDARLRFQNAGDAWPDSPVASFTNAVRAYSGVAGSRAWTVLVGGNGSLALKNDWREVATIAEWPGVKVVELVR